MVSILCADLSEELSEQVLLYEIFSMSGYFFFFKVKGSRNSMASTSENEKELEGDGKLGEEEDW